jgi:uncharacterized membrane protein
VQWVLAIAAGLFYAIGLPVALVLIVVLRRRVRALERDVAVMRAGATAPRVAPAQMAQVKYPEHVADVDGVRPRPLPTPPRSPGLEALIGGRWLTWVGVLAIFFGTAFFVAMDLQVGGVLQVLVGLLVALVFVLMGRWLARRRERVLGLGLLGGGVALLYLVAYGAYGFHHLVPALTVYLFLTGVAVVGALLALRQDAAAVAGLTVVGALLAPLLLEAPGDPSAALFPYLAAMNAGIVLVGRRTGWAGLPLAAFLGSVALLAVWADQHYGLDRRLATLLVTTGLWALYGITPLLERPSRDFWSAARGTVVLANALLFGGVLWQLLAPDHVHLRGFALAVLALVYVVGTRAGSRVLPAGPGLELTRVAGIALAALAVPAQLDQNWVTFGWTALAGVLLWADLRGAGRTYQYLGLGVLFLSLFKTMTIDPIAVAQRLPSVSPVTNGAFLAGLGVVALLVALSVAYRRRAVRAPVLSTVLLLIALVLLLWKITIEIAFAYSARGLAMRIDLGPEALLTITLVWALYALAVTAGGFVVRLTALRRLGIVLAALLVLKVFLLDWQELAGGLRVAAFAGVGLLLLVISVLYQRKRSEE